MKTWSLDHQSVLVDPAHTMVGGHGTVAVPRVDHSRPGARRRLLACSSLV